MASSSQTASAFPPSSVPFKWIKTLAKHWFGYMFENRKTISQDNNQEFGDIDASRSLSSSSSARCWKYDVFLNFRGPDTRKGITSDLYQRLQRRGIKTFMDDPDLEAGDAISPTLIAAIEESRFAIVVLSRDYASSAWCLEELAKICECMEDNNRILPIFFHVEPSEMRHQKRSFDEAFCKHETSGRHRSEKLKQWRDALTKVVNFSGWNTENYKVYIYVLRYKEKGGDSGSFLSPVSFSVWWHIMMSPDHRFWWFDYGFDYDSEVILVSPALQPPIVINQRLCSFWESDLGLGIQSQETDTDPVRPAPKSIGSVLKGSSPASRSEPYRKLSLHQFFNQTTVFHCRLSIVFAVVYLNAV